MMLIGITGRVREDIRILADYLVDEYGFARCAVADVDLEMELNKETGIVVAGVANNDDAEFVRRRGLLIHLRRPQAPTDAQPIMDGPQVFQEIDDICITNDGSDRRFYAKVDQLLMMIKWWGMYGVVKDINS